MSKRDYNYRRTRADVVARESTPKHDPKNGNPSIRAIQAAESLKKSISLLPYDYLRALENLVLTEKRRREHG